MPSAPQQHYHVKLLVALDGVLSIAAPMRRRTKSATVPVEMKNGAVGGVAGVVAPDVRHHTRVDGRVFGMLLDPRTDDARKLRRDVLGEDSMTVLSPGWVAAILPMLQEFGAKPCDTTSAAAIVKQVVNSLTHADIPLPPRDERVSLAIDHVAAHTAEPIKRCELARIASLSPDRFTHLFREEMGVSVRRFILWSRMRRANKLVLGGATLTEAAHGAGFTDSAHFAHTYQNLFGVSPSMLLNSEEVVVIAHR